MKNDNTAAISGSLTDKVAPSEADMAQRLQASTQTGSQQTTSNPTGNSSYVEALAHGMETPADENQARNQSQPLAQSNQAPS